MPNNATRCAACKQLRRSCAQDCILAPHFPSSNPQRFESAHQIFGASNLIKMLQQVPVQLRGQAADSMCYEANSRIRDPVYGCAGIVHQLQQQIIEVQTELVKTQGDILFNYAKTQLLLLQQQQTHQAKAVADHPKQLSYSEPEPAPLLESVSGTGLENLWLVNASGEEGDLFLDDELLFAPYQLK